MRRIRAQLISVLFAFCGMSQASAGQLDLGLGVGAIDNAPDNGFDLYWDLMLGYEFKGYEHWNVGGQIELIRGITNESEVDDEGDLAFSATGFYVTARPKNWWLNFKLGAVDVDYTTMSGDVSDVGVGVGAGIVLGSDKFRVHLFDYQRVMVGDEYFSLYTVSIGIFAY